MKAIKIVLTAARYILTIFLFIILVFVIAERVTDGKATLGGYQIYTVISGSMEPTLDIGDVIVTKKVDASAINIGDIVTYIGSKGELNGLTLTHRITDAEYDEEDQKYHFITQGDANEIADPEITEDNIKGVLVYHTVIFSFVSRLMTHAYAYYGLFVICGIYFSYQVISIFMMKDDEDEGEGNKA